MKEVITLDFSVHERVQQVRKSEKLSRAKFAEKVGFGRGVLDNIELKRVNDVKDVYIKAICSTFDVNEKWLLTGEGDMYLSHDEEIAKMFYRIMNQGDEAQKKIFAEISKIDGLTKDELQSIIDYMNFIKSQKKTPK